MSEDITDFLQSMGFFPCRLHPLCPRTILLRAIILFLTLKVESSWLRAVFRLPSAQMPLERQLGVFQPSPSPSCHLPFLDGLTGPTLGEPSCMAGRFRLVGSLAMVLLVQRHTSSAPVYLLRTHQVNPSLTTIPNISTRNSQARSPVVPSHDPPRINRRPILAIPSHDGAQKEM